MRIRLCCQSTVSGKNLIKWLTLWNILRLVILSVQISFNQMQPCLKIRNGSYNLLIKKLLHQFSFFSLLWWWLYQCLMNKHFITNWRLMINTQLFATVLERLLLFPFKTALWLRMILSRLLEVNYKIQQIMYSTVLPGFDLVQMADDCDEYILTKNRLSMNLPWSVRPQGEGGFIWSHRFFSPCSFIY